MLRVSRFFKQADLLEADQLSLNDTNLKVNELLFRQVDIADVVSAHQQALIQISKIDFDQFIISVPTPFKRNDMAMLAISAPTVVEKYVPDFVAEYTRRDWRMHDLLNRVYDSSKASRILGWEPEFTFKRAIEQLRNDDDYRSELSRLICVRH